MEFVIDTNILFSFFKNDSITRRIIIEKQLKLYAPKETFIELTEYASVLVIWFILIGAMMIITDWARVKMDLLGEIFWGTLALLTAIRIGVRLK